MTCSRVTSTPMRVRSSCAARWSISRATSNNITAESPKPPASSFRSSRPDARSEREARKRERDVDDRRNAVSMHKTDDGYDLHLYEWTGDGTPKITVALLHG